MPHVDEMFPSTYLKKEDLPAPQTFTISAIMQDGVDQANKPKWLICFHETQKKLWLNATNKDLLVKVLNSSQTEDWIGRMVTLWNDLSVAGVGSNSGSRGGIRVVMNPTQNSQQPLQQQSQGVYHSDDKGY